MSDAPLPNSPEARTPTGELIDQTATPPSDTTKPADSSTTTTTTTPPLSESKPSDPPKADAKPEAGKDGEKKPSLLNEKDKPAPAGAPEKYEAFKLPEGFTLNEAVAGEATAMFKEWGLTQDQAQKAIDFYTAKQAETAKAPLDAYANLRKEWRDAVKADPDIGPQVDKVRTTISRAIDSIGKPELATAFREAMDLTGAGDNPAFIKVFHELAQRVTEGGHVSGRGPSAHGQQAPGSRPATAASALYPNLPA